MIIEIASPWDKMSESGSSLLRLIQNNNTPKLDLLVRESLQNCLDAGDKTNKSVNVEFITGDAKTEKISVYFDRIQDRLNKRFGKTCSFIAIKDSNTVGLTGPVRKIDIGKDLKFGNYLKLVTEISKPQDQDGAGGSWGLGKTVFFRIGVGLVVYYSRIKLENGSFESRLSAALVEDETKSDTILPNAKKQLMRGIAWWGQTDSKDKRRESTIPITNESTIRAFLSLFGLEPFAGKTTGTIILIPFINKQELLDDTIQIEQSEGYQIPYWCKESIEEYLKISIQRWYAPRIQNVNFNGQYLNVSINGEKITYKKMAPIFQLVQSLYNATPNNCLKFNEKTITSKAIEIRSVFKKGSAIAGYLNYLRVTAEDLRMLPPNNLKNPYYYINKINSDENTNDPIVLFTRKPGMVVSYVTTGDWTDGILKTAVGEYIVALFVANSNNELAQTDLTIEEYLRKGEKADHMIWNDWVLPGGNPQIVAKIQKGVRRKLKDEIPKPDFGTEDRKNLGLGRALAEMFLPPDGFSYWDDSRGGSSGMGGTGGDGSRKKKSDSNPLPKNKTSHIILQQIAEPKYSSEGIEMPVRIIFGDKRKAIIEFVVDTEGKPINCSSWEKTFNVGFPVVLNSLTVTSVKKGKDNTSLIKDKKNVDADTKIGNITFSFEYSKVSGSKIKLIIELADADNTIIDGIMKYKLQDVQGSMILTEEA